MGWDRQTVGPRCIAEGIGTFILVFFGCGAVHAAVLTSAHVGLWSVSIVWGLAVMAAVYVVGGVSGAHINPAITLSLAVWAGFNWKHVVPYIASQIAGAFVAAAFLFAIYSPFLADYERRVQVVRGEPGSEVTAMCYGEFYPNPGLASTTELYTHHQNDALDALVPAWSACMAEVVGTMLLALVVFAVTDERNLPRPISRLAPFFIGLTVAILISVIAPLTQACLNPARDFGPRLFTFLAGWGQVALPGRNGHGVFTVYILAPLVGGFLGGGVYTRVVRPFLAPTADEKKES